MTDASLRPATAADARAIRRVARESWHAAYDGILGADAVETVVDDWYDVEELARTAENEDHVFPVATGDRRGPQGSEGDAVVGFAHAGLPPDGGTWNLFRIYTHPDHWGDGVGTALLERVEERLAERGVSTYELAVLADNEVGVSFYESRGFERVGTEETELAGVETREHWYRKHL